MAKDDGGRIERLIRETAGDLLFALDKQEDATVTVRGQVQQGTYIEICHVSLIVRKPSRTVLFRLDKNEGQIVMEPLKATR